MSPPVTIVMYHYVRPLAASRWPRLKALELADFLGQIDWLTRHYDMIAPAGLRAAICEGAGLPPRPCLLTFDDGYSDHYAHVFPALAARGLSAAFFAPCSSLVERRMLDVNKVQFTLAAQPDASALADELDALLRAEGLADPQALRAAHLSPNRFDPPEVGYVKRLLQHALPAPARRFATDTLFRRHVSADEAAFAEDLYLTPEQAREMRAGGMEFGGHGDLHLWHGESAPDELAAEVAGSVRALETVGAPVAGGFYCYPYGSENAAVRAAVAGTGFALGFTVEPRLCDPQRDAPLRLPRLDTNDLPKHPDAPGGEA